MIVDFHAHIFPPSFLRHRDRHVQRDRTFGALYADPRATVASAEDLVAAMDEAGVDVAVVMGLGWTDRGIARDANDYIIDSVKKYPGRLVGFAGVNPAWGGEAAKEAERCADAGLKGIGELHPDTQGYDLGDAKALEPLMEVALARGLIVTTHSSEPVGHTYAGKGTVRPEALWRFITAFPEAKIVCAHWGGGLPFYALMPEVAGSLANVYFDTAASPFLYVPAVFETVAGLVGAEKVLMGSDYSLLHPRRIATHVAESGLADDEKKAVLGGNAARLLGM